MKIDGFAITVCNSDKYLGLDLDGMLKFDIHIQSIVRKLSKHISIIAKLRHYASREILLKYYNCYVKFSYGILYFVWNLDIWMYNQKQNDTNN